MQQSFFQLVGRLLSDPRWRAFHVRAALGVTSATAAVLLAGSALVVPAERGAAGANITSFPKAVWWSIETATTVGYGDLYPVTAWGRVIASVTMLAGITTFGMVTAAIATWFVDRAQKEAREVGTAVRRVSREGEEAVGSEMRVLHQRFDRIEELLERHGER
ncbi:MULTISPECIES: potassium channel family protein [unclassified Streptomyces]|uniref:potassium channel family protein n=1 Tax=unclassified Streptomyces TaxID=2593676 RepID=UPI002252A018|nr:MULTISPECIES: potassium channel family protein [unclassified Streptomyces]MCX5144885.1 ion channel [Streptomyces sp. NBC_00338]WRZ62858.1 ion channel [Streptomyces sp. NBC_01257]